MNNGEIIKKVHNSMYQQIKKSGMATPVQVIIDLGYLSQTDHDLLYNGFILETGIGADIRTE